MLLQQLLAFEQQHQELINKARSAVNGKQFSMLASRLFNNVYYDMLTDKLHMETTDGNYCFTCLDAKAQGLLVEQLQTIIDAANNN